MTKTLNCDNIVSEFEPQSRYYVYFQTQTRGKCMKLFIRAAMSCTVPLLLFYRDSFGIKCLHTIKDRNKHIK